MYQKSKENFLRPVNTIKIKIHPFLLTKTYHQFLGRTLLKLIAKSKFSGFREMNIIQELSKYPNMSYYAWLRTKLKPMLPKVIWFKILITWIESEPCQILFETLTKFENKLILKIQFTPDIWSTAYFDPYQTWCISPRHMPKEYEIKDKFVVHLWSRYWCTCDEYSELECRCGADVGSLLDTYRVTLVHRNNFM